jgi:hypothetical protein
MNSRLPLAIFIIAQISTPNTSPLISSLRTLDSLISLHITFSPSPFHLKNSTLNLRKKIFHLKIQPLTLVKTIFYLHFKKPTSNPRKNNLGPFTSKNQPLTFVKTTSDLHFKKSTTTFVKTSSDPSPKNSTSNLRKNNL